MKNRVLSGFNTAVGLVHIGAALVLKFWMIPRMTKAFSGFGMDFPAGSIIYANPLLLLMIVIGAINLIFSAMTFKSSSEKTFTWGLVLLIGSILMFAIVVPILIMLVILPIYSLTSR